jgi:hypothetical protein
MGNIRVLANTPVEKRKTRAPLIPQPGPTSQPPKNSFIFFSVITL